MPLISARLPAVVRAALRPLLTHTYSRTGPPVEVVDGEDDWGNPTYTDGATVTGLPCVYLSSRRLVARDEGNVVVDVPTLHVPYDDTLAVGEIVTNITDRDGRVLVASAVVDTFDPAAEAGASVLKIAVLKSVVAVS